MIQIPTENVAVLLFFHFTAATASIRTHYGYIYFPPNRYVFLSSSSPDRDDSKCVIKRNLFYFMLIWGMRESPRASIALCFAIYQGGSWVCNHHHLNPQKKKNARLNCGLVLKQGVLEMKEKLILIFNLTTWYRIWDIFEIFQAWHPLDLIPTRK